MKKVLLIVLILIITSISAFGESIDDNYIDLIFSKLGSMSEAEKSEAVSLLSSFIGSDVGLEVLYLEALKQESAMASYNVSAGDVRRNIDALKTWSSEDRQALIQAGVIGDKATIAALNSKNANVVFIAPSLRSGLISKEISVKPYLKDKTFEDTATHWSHDHVQYLVERGIISGKDENNFDPEASISKAEIVTLVTKLMIEDMSKIPVYTGDASDVTSGKWYDGHMQRGLVLGLIEETESIDPMHNSSREEVVEILIKAINALEIPIDDSLKEYKGDFKDFDQISDKRKEAMTIAINLGFISGKGDGIIDPQSEIKRSEIAVVINKLYLYILDNLE
ncbi:MAG: S-layer homology domain-containing protein [Clostridiales bacterium]|nr:S-layer homology domain-containing protein [Clostridiales bacterium]